MRQDPQQKKYAGFFRRLCVLAVICPSFVGLTSITPDENNLPHRQIRKVGARVITPGYPSYLDLDPKF